MTEKTYTAEQIAQDLLVAGVCEIRGIGKLKVSTRKARQGRNPATGQTMTIPAKKVVKFSPSSKITDRINAG
jgi:DNA-binding protein HU-beta